MKKHYRLLSKIILLGLVFPLACQKDEISEDEQLIKVIRNGVWTQSQVSSDCSTTHIKRLHFQSDGTYRMDFEPKIVELNDSNAFEIRRRWGVEANQAPIEPVRIKTGTYQVRNGRIELKDETSIHLVNFQHGTLTYRDSVIIEQVNWQILQADGQTLKVAGEKKPFPNLAECAEFTFVPL